RISSLREITGAEWRDPESMSTAMQSQGVLPKDCPDHLRFSTIGGDAIPRTGRLTDSFSARFQGMAVGGERLAAASWRTNRRGPSTPRPSVAMRLRTSMRSAQDDSGKGHLRDGRPQRGQREDARY